MNDSRHWHYIYVFLVALIATGVILLVAAPPRGEPLKLSPPPTPGPITVYVVGAVAYEGVYELPQGSRVEDAVDTAGGLTQDADTNAVNLAQKITDGEKIFIPTIDDDQDIANSSENDNNQINASKKININTASQDELETLPEIGSSKAANIIDYRDKNGPYKQIEDLKKVTGIGDSIFNRIKDLITVE